MLFSKSISDLKYDDVEEFCKRFHEGLRVEYKSTFDLSVKKKLSRVVSSFANSYGGIIVVGVNAASGVPQEPFDGIEFEDREPRLTVENICRADVFPEAMIYQSLVLSRIPGKAFLVIQVNESPRAPHAIESSTQVYVRTGDSSNPTKLADIIWLDRLLMRRRDVGQRWDGFFAESSLLAKRLGMPKGVPLLELRIGPLYPTEVVIQREKLFEFLADDLLRRSVGFYRGQACRHPAGVLLSRDGNRARYLNAGDLGVLHYLEPLEATSFSMWQGGAEAESRTYPFWWITRSMLRVLGVAARLAATHGVCCDLRIEACLLHVSQLPFTLSFGDPHETLPVSTLSEAAPALTTCSSEMLPAGIVGVAVELLYQLRWLFGSETPHSREEIRPIVERELNSAQVPYPTSF